MIAEQQFEGGPADIFGRLAMGMDDHSIANRGRTGLDNSHSLYIDDAHTTGVVWSKTFLSAESGDLYTLASSKYKDRLSLDRGDLLLIYRD